MLKLIDLALYFTHQMPDVIALLFVGISAAGIVATWKLQERRERTTVRPALAAGLIVLIFGGADLALMAALPRLGLSYGPVLIGLSASTALRAAVWLAVLIMTTLLSRSSKNLPAAQPGLFRAKLGVLVVTNLLITAGILYAMYVEPFDLRVTSVRLESAKLASGRTLRIVHLSDIHVERITRRERAMLAQVDALQPDLILLTGDYLNIDYTHDPTAQRHGRELLSQLNARYGVYAIRGSPPVDAPDAMAALFDDSPIRLLQDEVVRIDVEGTPIYLAGIETVRGRINAAVVSSLMKQIPPDAFSILLYHSPDVITAAADAGVDLYLAGHTHGGQIRLPFYGAIVTFSALGKRFEAGQYQVGGTVLYVSRGIGMEGLRLPRARFLCPPEIVSIELNGQ